MIFDLWGDIVCLRFATWFRSVLNVPEPWPIALAEVRNVW